MDLDPLDLLSDLKGTNDETKVDGVQELTQEIMKKAQELDTAELQRVHNELEHDLKSETGKVEGLTANLQNMIDVAHEDREEEKENSFYTTSSMIKQDDFDDFGDLKEDITATKVVVKILIIVVIIAFICGVVFLLNQILDWGLF